MTLEAKLMISATQKLFNTEVGLISASQKLFNTKDTKGEHTKITKETFNLTLFVPLVFYFL